MKLKNSTAYPDYFLRRMISWICRQLELPKDYIAEAQFRNRDRGTSGHAWPFERRFVVSTSDRERVPEEEGWGAFKVVNPAKGIDGWFKYVPVKKSLAEWLTSARTLNLVSTTAHEITHLALHRFGYKTKVQQPVHRRKLINGGSEEQTVWHENAVLEAFQKDREALLAAWAQEPVRACALSQPSLWERRAAKAKADLARWQRKLKLAQTKVKQYKRRVAYYERKIGG